MDNITFNRLNSDYALNCGTPEVPPFSRPGASQARPNKPVDKVVGPLALVVRRYWGLPLLRPAMVVPAMPMVLL